MGFSLKHKAKVLANKRSKLEAKSKTTGLAGGGGDKTAKKLAKVEAKQTKVSDNIQKKTDAKNSRVEAKADKVQAKADKIRSKDTSKPPIQATSNGDS